jgi:alpha-ribazole phosphatase
MLVLPEPGRATRLVLVRHAEPDESARGRCCGRLDVPLSPAGTRQAAALARSLADLPFAAVYTSPLERARETARPIAAAQGLELRIHAGFRELDFGELEGMRYEDVASEHPGLFCAWMDEPAGVRFPGGESLAELRARVLPALDEIRERHDGEVVAAVAHGGVARVILAEALGMPGSALFRLDQACGGVSVVDWIERAPVVRAMNARLYSAA